MCGRLDHIDDGIGFVYARSYLARASAVPIYGPELPLQAGYQFTASTQARGLPLGIDDAMPDSWGRRLINHRRGELAVELGDLTYLVESGSDRIGALVFQASSEAYEAREVSNPTLNDIAMASERIEAGEPLTPALEAALLRGTSIGVELDPKHSLMTATAS